MVPPSHPEMSIKTSKQLLRHCPYICGPIALASSRDKGDLRGEEANLKIISLDHRRYRKVWRYCCDRVNILKIKLLSKVGKTPSYSFVLASRTRGKREAEELRQTSDALHSTTRVNSPTPKRKKRGTKTQLMTIGEN